MLMLLSCTVGVRARAVCGKYRQHLRGVERVTPRLYLWVASVWRTSKEREHHGRWVAELMVIPRTLPLFVLRPQNFAFTVVFAHAFLPYFCLVLAVVPFVGSPAGRRSTAKRNIVPCSPTTRHLLPDCMLFFWLCTCWLLLYFCLHRLHSFVLVFVRTINVFLDVFGFQVIRDVIL